MIGTAAAGRMDKTTTQQQPQFNTESAAEESVGDATAAVQPPVEDRLDDLESVPFGELVDHVEQRTQLGTTDGVPGPTGSELDQIPPSDPVEDQTQLGTDDQLPVEDTPALRGEQETTGSATEAGVVRTGLVEEKLNEPTQQQTQLGTGGVASKNLLSGAQKTVVSSSNNLEREARIRNCMILRYSKLNWVLNLVFKKHQQ